MNEAEESECKHCWHTSGIALLTNPPKIEWVCCSCGFIKLVTETTTNSDCVRVEKHEQR